MNRTHGDIYEVSDSAVGTTAAQIVDPGEGRVYVKITNINGSGNLYVGFDSTVSSTVTTQIDGGALANTESLEITNYTGPIWAEGDGADIDFRLHIVRQSTRAD